MIKYRIPSVSSSEAILCASLVNEGKSCPEVHCSRNVLNNWYYEFSPLCENFKKLSSWYLVNRCSFTCSYIKVGDVEFSFFFIFTHVCLPILVLLLQKMKIPQWSLVPISYLLASLKHSPLTPLPSPPLCSVGPIKQVPWCSFKGSSVLHGMTSKISSSLESLMLRQWAHVATQMW